MRILQIILGVLVVIAGFYCCSYPVATQVSLSGMFVIIMGLGMFIGGIAEIVNWNDARKNGMSSGWTLIGGIVSILLGIVLLGCDFFASGIVYATFVSYFMAIWLVVGGIARIGAALSFRKLDGSWLFLLILGVLMIIAGICCFSSPIILISMMGLVFGISMIIAGISLIGLAISARA